MRRIISSLFSTHCPNCGSIEFRGVGVRNSWESFLRLLLLPYRCDFCGRHFFLFRWQAPIEGTS
jgi:hypothetical protein